MDSRDSQGNTRLILAAKNKALLAMRELIKAKCNLNLTDNKGRTALHYACHKAMGAEMLLRAGADPDIPDEDGNRPIHMAATEGFDNIVMTLLDYGCNPDSANCFQKTAAHYLAMKNHWKAIDAIAAAGGDLTLLDAEGNSPLMCAIQRNRAEAVKILLLANCRPKTLPMMQNTCQFVKPLYTALQYKLYGIAKLLILAGANLLPIYEWIDMVEKLKKEREEALASRWDFEIDEDEEEAIDEEQEEALEWFREWIHKPHTLMQLCRMSIRQYAGVRLLAEQMSLPVPQAMRDYITLKEVEDHPVQSHLI